MQHVYRLSITANPHYVLYNHNHARQSSTNSKLQPRSLTLRSNSIKLPMEQPAHPYYPLGVPISNYIPNDRPLIQSLPAFGALIGAVIVSAFFLTGSGTRRHVRPIDRFAATWFALCKWLIYIYRSMAVFFLRNANFSLGGFLHVAFEGVYHFFFL